MPEIRDITISRVRLEPRRLRNFESVLNEFDDAIEFRVQTDGALPLDDDVVPVLYVGEAMVTEVRDVGDQTYSFLALDESRLEPGAPIALAYPRTPADVRGQTEYRYEAP